MHILWPKYTFVCDDVVCVKSRRHVVVNVCEGQCSISCFFSSYVGDVGVDSKCWFIRYSAPCVETLSLYICMYLYEYYIFVLDR